ncbi:hypothetical protein HY29_15360 [Hyphomonas beringensis]|uniref:Uncharacterized protein n=1 Tax=Hyphomonas beringensis TaxID=1280946 RepID=A0A062UDN1_9PROT|nr:hypothetical protein [Hyphomonas beringensis]KCZ54215.1 hypothetical protein HY29_15360 [Hyphomonas beringensis]
MNDTTSFGEADGACVEDTEKVMEEAAGPVEEARVHGAERWITGICAC